MQSAGHSAPTSALDMHLFVFVFFQFVSFREFIGGSFGDDLNRSQVMLAKEVLAEIPDQVMSYMKKYGVKPNPPRYEDIRSH